MPNFAVNDASTVTLMSCVVHLLPSSVLSLPQPGLRWPIWPPLPPAPACAPPLPPPTTPPPPLGVPPVEPPAPPVPAPAPPVATPAWVPPIGITLEPPVLGPLA